jgi:hypothetical protein
MASVSAHCIAFLCLASAAAAFSPAAVSFRVGAVQRSRCLARPVLRASAAPEERADRSELFDAKGNAKVPEKPIDRFHSKQYTSDTPVITSKFIGDQEFEDQFVDELGYWSKVRQATEDEFRAFKKTQESRMAEAKEKLETARDRKESLSFASFLPFVNFDKDIETAQAEVCCLFTEAWRVSKRLSLKTCICCSRQSSYVCVCVCDHDSTFSDRGHRQGNG